jgi:hypothetical protein
MRTANGSAVAEHNVATNHKTKLWRTGYELTRINSRKKVQKGSYAVFRCWRLRSVPLVRGVEFGGEGSFHCLRNQ